MSEKTDKEMMIVLGKIAEGMQRIESDVSSLKSDVSSLKEGQEKIFKTLDEHTEIQKYIRDEYAVKNEERLEEHETRIRSLEVMTKN